MFLGFLGLIGFRVWYFGERRCKDPDATSSTQQLLTYL